MLESSTAFVQCSPGDFGFCCSRMYGGSLTVPVVSYFLYVIVIAGCRLSFDQSLQCGSLTLTGYRLRLPMNMMWYESRNVFDSHTTSRNDW